MTGTNLLRQIVSEQPYEQWERDMLVSLAEQQRDDPTKSAIRPMIHSQTLRYEVTVKRIEQKLDEKILELRDIIEKQNYEIGHLRAVLFDTKVVFVEGGGY